MREVAMAMDGGRDGRRPVWARLEEYAIGVLYSFVERPADNWRFWAKITVVMFLLNAGPAIAIYLFFLGRDLGYFN